jgi:phosphate transport system substrate-binding protein
VGLTITLFLATWIRADQSAEPGTEVSFFFIKYTKAKPPTSDVQRVNIPRQTTSANSPHMLRVCGSDTIGVDLMPSIAAAFLLREGFGTASHLAMDGGGVTLTGKNASKTLSIEISKRGTKSGIDALVTGNCDIAMASRNPEEIKQLQAAVASLVINGGYTKQVIAKDGIAVIVNRANRLDSLSYPMLSKIFSGEVKDWKDVEKNSPESGEIRLILLDKNSGTRDEFREKVLGAKVEFSKPFQPEKSSNIKVSNEVSELEGAIGIVAFPYVGNAKSLKLSADENVDALYPSPQSIQEGRYILSRELYLISTKTSDNVKNFIDFARSDEGQALVERAGFVTYKKRFGQLTSASGVQDEYARTIMGADTQLMNVEFSTDSSKLNEKSLDELEGQFDAIRVFLQAGRRILLLGFTDSDGESEEYNRKLSFQRAQSIERLLLQNPKILASKSNHQDLSNSAQIKLFGFGSMRPIASNKSKKDKVRNRRVEIWVK